jgi:lipopolysaccharide/colanic/teichoic acid biosynthesis glycosyltransferase
VRRLAKYRYRLYLIAKRWLDIGLSGVAIILLMPLMLAIAIAVKLESRGPALVEEERVGTRIRGKGGRKSWEVQKIALYKFRTTSKHDGRVTKVGKILQGTRLESLPRLLNILKGNLSFVGPYPARAHEVQTYAPAHLRRLEAKPGLTGWSQIEAPAHADFETIALLDAWYAENANLWLDIIILFRAIGSPRAWKEFPGY